MPDSQVLVQTKVFPREESQSSPTPQPALSNKIPAVRWTYPTTKWILPRTIQGKKMSPSPVPLYGRHKSPDSTLVFRLWSPCLWVLCASLASVCPGCMLWLQPSYLMEKQTWERTLEDKSDKSQVSEKTYCIIPHSRNLLKKPIHSRTSSA